MQEIGYGTNGITTILQDPERAKVLIRATNVGTVVEQDNGTHNWFHVPLTTPTDMATIVGNNNITVFTIRLDSVHLSARVNENARISRLHIRDGTSLIFDRDVRYIDRNIEEYLSLPEAQRPRVYSGLAMSLFVEFLSGSPRGRFEIRSAQVRYRITGPGD
jgi:hypothetical protein